LGFEQDGAAARKRKFIVVCGGSIPYLMKLPYYIEQLILYSFQTIEIEH